MSKDEPDCTQSSAPSTVDVDEVRRALTGDHAAFAALVRRHQDVAFAYALSLVRDFQMAEDVTQDAFLAAYLNLRHLASSAAFGSWVRGIVHHQAHRRLRRRRRSAATLEGVTALAWTDESPPDSQARAEATRTVFAALETLPAEQRTLLLLAYVRDQSQQQVAAFLGVPVSTVNNRLHTARKALKQRSLEMVRHTLDTHRLPDDFADRIGRILRMDGPVVEVRFDGKTPPEIFDAITVAGPDGRRSERLKVAQRLPDGVMRCVVTGPTDGLAMGMDVLNARSVADTATAGSAVRAVADDAFVRVIELLSPPPAGERQLLETGIKPIDLFCPLVQGGSVGLFGIQGVGRIVLVEELLHRVPKLGARANVFYLVLRSEPDAVREMLTQEKGYPGDKTDHMQVVWLLSDWASSPQRALATEPFDASIFCSPLLGAQGLWPAIDPLLSRSRLIEERRVSDAHLELATRARETLVSARELLTDRVFLELLANRAHREAAKRAKTFAADRLLALNDTDRRLVTRARKLERFLTNPFHVAEPFTKIAGVHVPLADTLAGVKAILDGAVDELPEDQLAYIGPLEHP